MKTGIKHTENDAVVNHNVIRKFQTLLNDHSRLCTETFDIGGVLKSKSKYGFFTFDKPQV